MFLTKTDDTFYDAYVKSRILFGVFIYSNTTETYLIELLKAQKRIKRTIYFKRPRDSVFELMNKNLHATVFGLFLFELFRQVFYELRNDSPVQLLNLSGLEKRRSTRASAKGLLP